MCLRGWGSLLGRDCQVGDVDEQCPGGVDLDEDLLGVGEVALIGADDESGLAVSASAIAKWYKAGLITPEFVTLGGHPRWDVDRVRQQLRDQRQRDE